MLSRFLCTVIIGVTLSAAGAQAAGLMIVHHKVTNYAKWRPVFDGDKANQEAAGLTSPHVYRSVADANNVTITFDMADAAKAKAFGTSKALKARMTKAGVKGAPQIFYLDSAP
jgi:hypothetical protein